jgi:TctA family transporter
MIDWLQWPAMVATLVAAWLVASKVRSRRLWGFATFVLSNVLWVVWAVPAGAYALVVLQIGLFALNLRGIRNNEGSATKGPASPEPAA